MESKLERTGVPAKATRRAVLGAAVVGTVWSVPVVKAAADTPAKTASSFEGSFKFNNTTVDDWAPGAIIGNFGIEVVWPAQTATFTVIVTATPVGGGPTLTREFTGTGAKYVESATALFSGLTKGEQYNVTFTATAILTSYTSTQTWENVSGRWNMGPIATGPFLATIV